MKKNAKKLFLLVAVVITAVVCLVFSAGAGTWGTYGFDASKDEAEVETWGDYEYKVLEDGTIAITGYNGNDTDLTIVSQINGSKVTQISDDAFWHSFSLENVVIPNGVKSIGSYAFYNCEDLVSVTIPDGVTSIGAFVFDFCRKLENVTIPDSVTSIGKDAFSRTTFYDDYGVVLYIGNHLIIADSEEIPDTGYAVKEGTLTIADNAFDNSDYLENIIIPNSVRNIGNSAFEGCYELKDVYYTGSKSQWAAMQIGENNGCLLNANIHYGYGCTHKTVVTLEAEKPTCAKTGLTEGKKCSACETVLVEQETVEKKPHSYKTTTTEATLTKNGKTVKKCTVCDYKKTTTIYYPKTIKLSKTEYTYNGKEQKPTVTVKDSKGNFLKEGKKYDYTVKYESGRKEPGRYTVKITFTGNYEGEKKLTYTIAPETPSRITSYYSTKAIKLTWLKVTGADGYRVYQYNTKTKKWDTVKTVTSASCKIEGLKAGTKYKFKVKAYTKDEGTIWGESSATYEAATRTKTPSLKVTSPKKGTVTLSWASVPGADGYQMVYSTKKDSGYSELAACNSNVLKCTNSRLTSGKTYYFKIRTFEITDNGIFYSDWSSDKSVKIK